MRISEMITPKEQSILRLLKVYLRVDVPLEHFDVAQFFELATQRTMFSSSANLHSFLFSPLWREFDDTPEKAANRIDIVLRNLDKEEFFFIRMLPWGQDLNASDVIYGKRLENLNKLLTFLYSTDFERDFEEGPEEFKLSESYMYGCNYGVYKGATTAWWKHRFEKYTGVPELDEFLFAGEWEEHDDTQLGLIERIEFLLDNLDKKISYFDEIVPWEVG